MRREQPRKTSNTTRVTVPLPHSLLLSATVGTVIKGVGTERLYDYVMSRVKRGLVDEYYATDDPDSELGMTFSIKIEGSWYHLEFFKIREKD